MFFTLVCYVYATLKWFWILVVVIDVFVDNFTCCILGQAEDNKKYIKLSKVLYLEFLFLDKFWDLTTEFGDLTFFYACLKINYWFWGEKNKVKGWKIITCFYQNWLTSLFHMIMGLFQYFLLIYPSHYLSVLVNLSNTDRFLMSYQFS
jgi:hypothetical protein